MISEAFSFAPTVSNPNSVSLTYSAVGSLPAGLSISATTGAITGTPSVAATTSGLKIRAVNSGTTVDSNTFSIVVQAAPSIASITNQNVVAGESLTITPSITNTDSVAVVCSITGTALPAGLSIAPSTGVISGNATGSAGTTSGVKVRVSFGVSSHVDTGTFNIQIKAIPSVATVSDQAGSSGHSFTFTPTITNTDSLTITYSITGTALPSGLSISSTTGAITGTPASAATTNGVKIRLSYGNSSHTDSNAFAIAVDGALGRSNLGMNVSPLEDYGTQFPYNNIIKEGREWTASSGSLTLDSLGYPTSLAGGQSARMYWITAVPNESSAYTPTHSGTGTFTQSSKTPTGMFFDLTATTSGDNLRNLKMPIPGTDINTEFYTPFITALNGFGTIRFMDWVWANNSVVVEWADRTPDDYYTYAAGAGNGGVKPAGVPYESCIRLCNQLNCDMWICTPHLASDDFITQLATLIKANLNTNLKCYYEASNERWNSVFAQAVDARAKGVGLGLDANAFQAQLKYHSQESVRMFDLVDAVYGTEKTARRRRVMGGWTEVLSANQTILNWLNAYQKTDFLAVAPYMELNADQTGKTTQQILDLCCVAGDGYDYQASKVAAVKAFCDTKGVGVAFYEFGPGSSLTPTVQRHNGMEALNNAYMQSVWVNAAGAPVANWYFLCRGFSTGNSWGALEDISITSTPKMRSLQHFLDGYTQSGSGGGSSDQAPIITTISNQTATQNVAFSFAPTVSNPSSLTQSFSISGTLPTGLTISSTTGTISGTPTVVQTKTGLSIQDGYSGTSTGSVGSNLFQIDVAAAGSGPVSGSTLWLDPSDAATITLNAGNVSQITDKSGNSHTFAQSSAGSQPPTSTLNSLTALSFPFSGYYLQSAAIASTMLNTTGWTTHIVVNVSSISSNNSGGTNNNAAWGDINGMVGCYFSSGKPSALGVNNDGTEDVASLTTMSLSTTMVLTVQLSGGLIKISKDGLGFATAASGNTAALTTALYLGRGEGASPWLAGKIGEVLMYNTALSDANMTTNINYLKTKWGVA